MKFYVSVYEVTFLKEIPWNVGSFLLPRSCLLLLDLSARSNVWLALCKGSVDRRASCCFECSSTTWRWSMSTWTWNLSFGVDSNNNQKQQTIGSHIKVWMPCGILRERFVRNIFIFPELLVLGKYQATKKIWALNVCHMMQALWIAFLFVFHPTQEERLFAGQRLRTRAPRPSIKGTPLCRTNKATISVRIGILHTTPFTLWWHSHGKRPHVL